MRKGISYNNSVKDSIRLFPNIISKDETILKNVLARGDWSQTKSILSTSPQHIIEEVKKSGLRGRGGAGFLTGEKWGMMLQNVGRQSYLVVNADEGESGTCKDRDIIRYEPNKIIEGALIAAYAIGAKIGYIYIRGEYYQESLLLQRSIEQAYEQKLIGKNACNSGHDFDLFVHRGAGSYICGEETALLNSLEGKRGIPRLKPQFFPTHSGLYKCPTVVNNVETIASIPSILRYGATWFNSLGRPNNHGMKVFSISGHVNTPCNIEAEMSTPLRELIDKYGNGVKGGWNNLMAVIPGGGSAPLLPKHLCEDLLMDFDSVKNAGSDFGTGGIVVMDKSTNIVQIIVRSLRFYADESCGQCTPCREGVIWLYKLMLRLAKGCGSSTEIDTAYEIANQITGKSICALGDSAANIVKSLITHFREEIKCK